MKRLKLRVFVFLVLRANITEYSQSNSSHVRLPLKWGDRFVRFYRPISLSVLLNCWCLPVNIPASRSTISSDPQNWREAFPIKKQLSGRQKQGQSHQLVTGELQRNLDNSPRVALLSRFLQLLSTGSMIKSKPRNGVQISLHRSRKRPRRVCNVPCNIFMCLRV